MRDASSYIIFALKRCDTPRQYPQEAPLAQKLPRSQPRRLEGRHTAAPVLISFPLSPPLSITPDGSFQG